MLALFLAFLASCGINRGVPRYRLLIHESADAEATQRWWAERLGLPLERFGRATLKRHEPATTRRNNGEGYRGCLVITVPRSRHLYWRVEGVIRGVEDAVAGMRDE
ncbi:hypothetical protein [Micromonospora sp. NPDC049282]|uniref:hypothetical protein n=1 Tax=Micromonospora sp. NPDC049282 TaxID=3364269 RepID=UPI0037103A04